MKKFRSSKNLKPMDPQVKQQAQLKIKIRVLEEQINMLQKSNLNIFVPITDHAVPDTIDYQSIINKLKQSLLGLEHENQAIKLSLKKALKQKQEIVKRFTSQIEELKNENSQLKTINQELEDSLEEIRQELDEANKKCEQLDTMIIQKNVQIRFLNEDLKSQKAKKQSIEKQFAQLKLKISEVIFSSRIYKSTQIKCVCIQKQQYDSLKDKILQLENQIKSMIESTKRQKINLGYKRSDIGEEIVRLKKNIDLQLGLGGESKHSEQFLKIYKGTNDLFTDLIKKCQV